LNDGAQILQRKFARQSIIAQVREPGFVGTRRHDGGIILPLGKSLSSGQVSLKNKTSQLGSFLWARIAQHSNPRPHVCDLSSGFRQPGVTFPLIYKGYVMRGWHKCELKS